MYPLTYKDNTAFNEVTPRGKIIKPKLRKDMICFKQLFFPHKGIVVTEETTEPSLLSSLPSYKFLMNGGILERETRTVGVSRGQTWTNTSRGKKIP